jgi:hypothetical protein
VGPILVIAVTALPRAHPDLRRGPHNNEIPPLFSAELGFQSRQIGAESSFIAT